jgi:uncharacterized membrane protein
MKKLIPLLAATLLGGCATMGPPPPAAPYHALGTEPFWNLLIDEHDLTFTQPDAAPIQQRTPPVIHGFAGEIYQTPRINVNIVHAQCSDGMSDRVYPDKVQVTVDGKRFDGCGGL